MVQGEALCGLIQPVLGAAETPDTEHARTRWDRSLRGVRWKFGVVLDENTSTAQTKIEQLVDNTIDACIGCEQRRSLPVDGWVVCSELAHEAQ